MHVYTHICASVWYVHEIEMKCSDSQSCGETQRMCVCVSLHAYDAAEDVRAVSEVALAEAMAHTDRT